MSRLYLMLSVAGWAWLVGLVGYVTWRRRRDPKDGDAADKTGE